MIPGEAHLPTLVPAWSPTKILFEGAATVCFEVCEPGDLRLTLDFGFAAIVTVGVDDVGDLIEGFRLADEERVSCHRYGFVLGEIGEDADRRVVYRDKAVEVRIPRTDYDRISGIVSELVVDSRVQAAFEQAYRHHASAARVEAWAPARVRLVPEPGGGA